MSTTTPQTILVSKQHVNQLLNSDLTEQTIRFPLVNSDIVLQSFHIAKLTHFERNYSQLTFQIEQLSRRDFSTVG